MDYSVDHDVLTSLKEYSEYNLISNKTAYRNVTDYALYPYDDLKHTSNTVQGSQFCQLCYHSELAGISVPVIEESSTPKAEGSDGLMIDYQHGRAILDPAYTGSLTISATPKDFNTYISSDSDENIVFHNKYDILPHLDSGSYNKDPYGYCVPAIFYKINASENEIYCFGGSKKTNWTIRTILMADSEFLLLGAVSCFRDLDKKCFPLIGAANSPLNEYGALKDPNWAYSDFLNNSLYDTCYIEKVVYSPVQPTQFTKLNTDIYIGLCDFFISTRR